MSGKRILIFGGRVIDPANDVDGYFDVEIENGKISKIDEKLSTTFDGNDVLRLDAQGCIVTPGNNHTFFSPTLKYLIEMSLKIGLFLQDFDTYVFGFEPTIADQRRFGQKLSGFIAS
jgi:hypothetical protein